MEEIFLSEELHTITQLPVHFLSKLKSLFICNDKNVPITDHDLKYMTELVSIELSHNNTITLKVLDYLPKLQRVILYSNKHLDGPSLLKRYKIVTTANYQNETTERECSYDLDCKL